MQNLGPCNAELRAYLIWNADAKAIVDIQAFCLLYVADVHPHAHALTSSNTHLNKFILHTRLSYSIIIKFI